MSVQAQIVRFHPVPHWCAQAVYKRFRQLVDRWIALSIQRGIIDGYAKETLAV